MEREVLYFTKPHSVEVRQEPTPNPKADELLVKTAVSAISAGTEMLLYRGQMPTGMAVDETIASLAGEIAYPLTYGYQAVGRVVETGAAVDKGWNGRLVFSFQPHQSYFTARPDEVMLVPEGIGAETAVFLPNMETAVSFIMDGQPVIGEQVAVFGQGIVGLLTTSLLAQLPLASLVTLDAYPLRRDWSLKRGAQASLDPTEADSLVDLRGALQGKRPFAGADLSYELSGNPQALDQAIKATGYSGRIVIGSWYGQKRFPIDLGGHFHRSHIRLISSQVSTIAPQWNGRWTKPRRLQTAWDMLRKHNPAELISHRFRLDEATKAYRLLDEGAETAVQVVFKYL
ncbi:MAG: zinc-binding alcohol dehydrogenase [Chloroflexota bacterium]